MPVLTDATEALAELQVIAPRSTLSASTALADNESDLPTSVAPLVGVIVSVHAGGGTVTVLEAERSIFFTSPLHVIVAVPFLTAVTLALLSTVATDASLEAHVRVITFRNSIGRAFMSAADSANWRLLPRAIVAVAGSILSAQSNCSIDAQPPRSAYVTPARRPRLRDVPSKFCSFGDGLLSRIPSIRAPHRPLEHSLRPTRPVMPSSYSLAVLRPA